MKPTEYGDNSANYELKLDELTESTLQTNKHARKWMDLLVARGASDLGKEASDTVATAQVSQQLWVDQVIDYTIFHSELHGNYFGDIAPTPFLEPKSITQVPEVIYPFSTTPF